MSQGDEFSISELRKKREQSQALSAPPPPPPGASGGGPSAAPGPEPRPAGYASSTVYAAPRPALPGGPGAGRNPATAGEDALPVDPLRLVEALKRRWQWLVIAAVVAGVCGFLVGKKFARSEISIKLARPTKAGFDDGLEGQTFKFDRWSMNTIADLMASPELARRGATNVNPPLSAEDLLNALTVLPTKDMDLVTLKFKRRDPQTLPALANSYADVVVAFTKELQVGEAKRLADVQHRRLDQVDDEIKQASGDLVAFQAEHAVEDPTYEASTYTKKIIDIRVQVLNKQTELAQVKSQLKFAQEDRLPPGQSPLIDQLAAAQEKLRVLRLRYTDQHFEVKNLLAEIAALEEQAASATNAPAGGGKRATGNELALRKLGEEQRRLESEIAELERARTDLQKRVTGMSEIELKYLDLRGRLDSLRQARQVLAKRLKETEQFVQNAQGYYNVFAYVTPDDVDTQVAAKKAQSFGVKAALLGFLGMAGLVVLADLRHRTIKTVSEVERITHLRVLATLGNLDKLSVEEREKWAFRAWTVLAGQLNASANQGMVCGFMSSTHGEGRSTWIRLLGNAASQRGLRVLTIATKPSGTGVPDTEAESDLKEKSFGDAVNQAMNESAAAAEADPAMPGAAVLSADAFAFPAEVTQKFAAGQVPAAHIPLPGWVWNLERRRQWQSALAHWRAIDNLVLLVELPPAVVPESVLLAESLPQVVWLVDSGKAPIRETKEQLEMLRHAKCRLVGAVLNHEPAPLL